MICVQLNDCDRNVKKKCLVVRVRPEPVFQYSTNADYGGDAVLPLNRVLGRFGLISIRRIEFGSI